MKKYPMLIACTHATRPWAKHGYMVISSNTSNNHVDWFYFYTCFTGEEIKTQEANDLFHVITSK